MGGVIRDREPRGGGVCVVYGGSNRILRGRFRLAAPLVLLLATGCSVHNVPVNIPTNEPNAGLTQPELNASYSDEFLIALAFSGGGTRAAAYSFGVLRGIEKFQLPGREGPVSLIDRIDFVSGVSGGSVTAAYFGLKKRNALYDFRERFLLKNAEENLSTSLSPGTLVRGLSGGANDATHLPRWLNENLFEGATFSAFRESARPRIWINASDIYNRTPFIFGRTAFAAMCSDLNSYPIADAVAASAAVPVVFAPIVIESYPDRCNSPLPDWIVSARANPNAPPLLKSYANAIGSYRDGTVKYAKLLDGGLVDNYGLSGFTIARLSARYPYEPLHPAQAVKLKRALFLVVDAGRAPKQASWTTKLEGPAGADLISAAADTAIDASVRASFSAFEQTMEDWRQQLVRWRCGLSAAQRKQYGAPERWNCRDVRFFIARLGFDQLGQARSDRLNGIVTRLQLPQGEVDELIQAGEDTLISNQVFQSFLNSTRR
ncbi:MAG: patatin-like phospholipase family protein [Xanthobacteraceae bacterium]|nr:patatin-like phospholipase family protein [Xanthobacteraceae bacterium]QYK43779.1 MAG: patatin-like phospholipase family protein [Xanthobacteraceae bacterium]